MEKKMYITPACIIVEISIESAMLSASNPASATFDNIGEDEEITLNSNRRRGQWGDLWSD